MGDGIEHAKIQPYAVAVLKMNVMNSTEGERWRKGISCVRGTVLGDFIFV